MGSRCELSFIERYSVSEANDLLDDLLSLTKDLSSLVITGTYINKDKVEVRSYLKALNSYIESGTN